MAGYECVHNIYIIMGLYYIYIYRYPMTKQHRFVNPRKSPVNEHGNEQSHQHIAMENPGKYRQHGGLSIAMLVNPSVLPAKHQRLRYQRNLPKDLSQVKGFLRCRG